MSNSQYEKLTIDPLSSASSSSSLLQSQQSNSLNDYRRQYSNFYHSMKHRFLNIAFAIIALLILSFTIYLCYCKYNTYIDEEEDMLSTQYQYYKMKTEEKELLGRRESWSNERTKRRSNIDKYHQTINDLKNNINELNEKKSPIEAMKLQLNQYKIQLSNMNILINNTNDMILLSKDIESLKNDIMAIKKYIDEIKPFPNNNCKEDHHDLFEINSHIITSNKQFNLIRNFFESPDKIIGLQLLYRKSDHGAMPQNFHSVCDNIYNTLVLIDSGEFIVGGFTMQSWNSVGHWKTDFNAFLFNLSTNVKCSIKDPGSAIYCSKDAFPMFGKGDLYVGLNEVSTIFPRSYSSDSGNANDFIKDSHSFNVKELEVFRVIMQ